MLSKLTGIMLLALLLLSTSCNAHSLGLILAEVLHSGIAINDLVSDILLTRDIGATNKQYQKLEDEVNKQSKEPYYDFNYCFPAPIKNASWENHARNLCACRDFEAYCTGSRDDNDTDANNGLLTIDDDSIVPYTNNTDVMTDLASIVKKSATCNANIWALDEQYARGFSFDDWRCAECVCSGDIYYKNQSIPLQRTIYEYEALYSLQIEYCDPHGVGKNVDEYLELLEHLYNAAIAFCVVGAIFQCIDIVIRAMVVSAVDDDDDMDDTESKATITIVRFGLGFLVSLMEDVPQTILAMYYIQALYSDHGYHCYKSWATMPDLTKMIINPRDSISVILMENLAVGYAVTSSIFMIIYKGFHAGYKLQGYFREIGKDGGDDSKGYVFGIVSMLILIAVVYVLCLLMPIAAVAYFDIAPTFHKTWEPAFIVFVAGCCSWGLFCCGCCCIGVIAYKA